MKVEPKNEEESKQNEDRNQTKRNETIEHTEDRLISAKQNVSTNSEQIIQNLQEKLEEKDEQIREIKDEMISNFHCYKKQVELLLQQAIQIYHEY